MTQPSPEPQPPARVEILSMRVEMNPFTLRWGGVVCASFALRAWPYLVADCRLVRCPDGTWSASLNMGGRRNRITVQDRTVKEAIVAAAAAEFERKTAHLRPAVSARREGFSPLENPAK